MRHALLQADRVEGLLGQLRRSLPAHARIHQRQLHIVQCRGAGEEVKGLEDETDLAVPDPGQLVVIELATPGGR